MQKFLLPIIVAVAAFPLTTTASEAASNSAWCLKAANTDENMIDICEFQTFAQCTQERFNYGSTSFCVQNPAYDIHGRKPGEAPRKSKRNSAG